MSHRTGKDQGWRAFGSHNEMWSAALWKLGLLGSGALLSLACVGCSGGSDENSDMAAEAIEEPDRFPELEAAEPLDLKALQSADKLGVAAHHGEFRAAYEFSPTTLVRARDIFPHALYRVQSYDELTQQYGEYTYYSITGPDVESSVAYLQNKGKGKVTVRVKDLEAEINNSLGQAGASAFDERSVVIDFWRTNREWLVRWDGLLDQEVNVTGIGPYGLARQEMRDDLLASIEQVATDLKPEYMILGEDMEQLWLKGESGKLDVYDAEWFAFLLFYQDAVARIRSASPETRVGVGINWDVFVNQVSVEYGKLELGDAEGAGDLVPSEELLDRAFRGILLPLAEWGDVLTLRSYRAATDDATWYYQFLRRLEALYGEDIPVVWYDIGTPTDGSATAQRQRNYIDTFTEWNAGVNVEALFWGRLYNIDGADGSNQTITGRCKSLVEDTDKNFMLPRERCFDGLFDTIFNAKPGLLAMEEQVK